MADFLKLHRKVLNWGWYRDNNTKIVFFHCLLKANWKPGEWKGIKYEAGEFITSLETLANETNLTISQVRTAIYHLKMTGEIASKSQGKCRVITVNNWNVYQTDSKEDSKEIASKSQGDSKEIATDIDIKNKRSKEVKNIYGEYKHVRLTQKQYDKLVVDYGEDDTKAAIKKLDEYIQMKGKTYKDHNLVMRNWVFDAIRKDKQNDTVAGRTREDEEQHNAELDEHIRRIQAGEFDAEDEELKRMFS